MTEHSLTEHFQPHFLILTSPISVLALYGINKVQFTEALVFGHCDEAEPGRCSIQLLVEVEWGGGRI